MQTSVPISRCEQIDIEKCLSNHGENRYDMILEVARRAKQLKKRDSLTSGHVINALLELQNKS